jgi:hypothetical protein
MSERRILYRTFDNWLGGHRKRFGPDWMGESSWSMNNIVNQFIRYAGFMYSSTKDFEQWLDNEFDSLIQQSVRDAGKPTIN